MFISYSITDSRVSVWYVDDINYPKQAKDLIEAFDLTYLMATGYEVASNEDIDNILHEAPYDCVNYLIDEDIDIDTWLHFDTIFADDEDDSKPILFLVCRSKLEAYIYSLYDEYKTEKNMDTSEELAHYWYNQR